MRPIRTARLATGIAILILTNAAPLPLSPASAQRPGEVMLPKEPSVFGEYRLAGHDDVRILIEEAGDPSVVRVRTTAGWSAVGYFQAGHFEGVVRSADLMGAPLPGPFGTLAFDHGPDGSIAAVLRVRGDAQAQRWLFGFPRVERVP